MPFQLSPGVNVSEIDLTTIVPAVATTDGAFAGVFRWGPVEQRILIDTETNLVNRFGKPSNLNAETWFTAASFLGYGNRLHVSRAANTTGLSPIVTSAAVVSGNATVTVSSTASLNVGMAVISAANSTVTGAIKTGATISTIVNATAITLSSSSEAIANLTGGSIQFVTNTAFSAVANGASVANLAAQIVKNEADFESKTLASFDSDVYWVARHPGEVGNSLRLSVCGNSTGFNSTLNLASNSATFTLNVNSNTATLEISGSASFTNTTFNANTDVNGTTEFITLSGHTFANDDVLLYLVSTGNTVLSGLTNNTSYYVVSANSTGIKLSTSLGGSAVDVAASSTSETGHTLSRVDTTAAANANSRLNTLKGLINVTDKIEIGNTEIGTQYIKVTAVGNVTSTSTNNTVGSATMTISLEDEYKLAENFIANTTVNSGLVRYWEFFNQVETAPGQSEYHRNFGNSSVNSDEMHVVVIDESGKFSGVPGTILEVYQGVSRATDAKTLDGAANYYREVINDRSNYIYAINPLSGASANTAENLTSSTLDVATYQLGLGKDGADESNIPLGILAKAYDMFASAEDVDISLVLTGKSNSFQLVNYLIDNIAEARKDCVVFCSPQKSNVVNNPDSADSIVSFRNNVRSTSYAVMDSGYKYMYDRYNDLYRWVPLNGDVAGLCVRTDNTNDPWWSPAGFNRGQIKNLVKLAFNPRKAERDILYKNGINPVVTFPGQGTVLFGDKTLLAKPSAFDRINVRRLFIVLEKAIAVASKFTLFEFNDAFTRAQFRNLINPYLRDVQGRRGVYDFLVVCDESNNTPEVIDRNEFVGDIYIKPARSINFIQLNFVAVRTGVSFSEVVGQF